MTREQLFLKRGARPESSKQNVGHGNGAVASEEWVWPKSSKQSLDHCKGAVVSEEWGAARKFKTEPGPSKTSCGF